jgi:hypothetical protein
VLDVVNIEKMIFDIKLFNPYTLFKLDYLEQFYPNQSFARLNPGVMAQRLISKD